VHEQQRIAILIGCDGYDHLAALPTPLHDVEAMRALLADPAIGHFTRVIAFNGSESENQVVSVIEPLLVEEADPDDLVLIYFSGHGKVDNLGNLYLALKPTRESALDATSIGLERIRNYLHRSRCKSAVLILDCCYSGAAKKAFAKGAVSDSIRQKAAGSGLAILTSSSDIQESYAREGDNYSLFTKMLHDGISTGFADRDNDGVITVDEAYTYAYNAVRATGLQHPNRINLDAQGELVLAHNPRYKASERPSLAKCPPALAQVYAVVDQMVSAVQRGEKLLYLVMLGGYWIDGFPYPANSLTVDPEYTPNMRQTQDGFECDTWFEPKMLVAPTREEKEVVKVRKGERDVDLVKVRLKVFLKDIMHIAAGSKAQQVQLATLYTMKEGGGNPLIEFHKETAAFFEKYNRERRAR
jgi:hypothetical protein